MVAALVLGVLGAVLAILFQWLAVGLAGFAVGVQGSLAAANALSLERTMAVGRRLRGRGCRRGPPAVAVGPRPHPPLRADGGGAARAAGGRSLPPRRPGSSSGSSSWASQSRRAWGLGPTGRERRRGPPPPSPMRGPESGTGGEARHRRRRLPRRSGAGLREVVPTRGRGRRGAAGGRGGDGSVAGGTSPLPRLTERRCGPEASGSVERAVLTSRDTSRAASWSSGAPGFWRRTPPPAPASCVTTTRAAGTASTAAPAGRSCAPAGSSSTG